MIIGYLFYNSPALRSCSLTCYSWYIAAVPHLHSTLDMVNVTPFRGKRHWPNCIRYKHMLGLLPLVKTVLITGNVTFSPKWFNCCTLRQFLTLTNVQSLEIRHLDIPSFMPRIRRYFRPFLPTLQSLHLFSPIGSDRQIIFFVGLFQHLENLSLKGPRPQGREPEDLTLIPPFTPPLRGELIGFDCKKAGLFQDMVHLFGGIGFYAMDLFDVNETRLLLRACAKTLSSLRLYPNDPLGERLHLKPVQVRANDLIARSALLDFDLSLNKSLSQLEVPVGSVDSALRRGSLDTASRFLKYTLSTIQSPGFSQVRLVYRLSDFHAGQTRQHSRWLARPGCYTPDPPRGGTSWYRRRFGVFREAQRVRDFQLVLIVYVPKNCSEDVVGMLKEDVAAENARGGFDDCFPAPLAIFIPTGVYDR